MYLTHITTDGDRWDLLADRYYGDVNRMRLMIEANPTVPITTVLPAGIRLTIPIIPRDDANTEDLPPWKR